MKHLFRILAVLFVLVLAWYLTADRMTPYTSNARVKGVIAPIVPQVSGIVTEVAVANGVEVPAGTVLARIDRRSFEIARDAARADLALALQQIGASSAGVASAQAQLSAATTQFENASQQAARVFELERKGLIAVARADDARAKLREAESARLRAEAELERARQQLGPEGQDNPAVQRALAALAAAELDLERTALLAPARGVVSDLNIAPGVYAQAGAPLMTFLDAEYVWIEAYMTENNLGRVRPGDRAEVTLDIEPGRILEGRVESFSGAAAAGTAPRGGQLASAPRSSGWMREPQRFPLRILLPGYEAATSDDDVLFQLNGQADVIVYTGAHPLLNRLGAWYIRAMSWLSYAY